MRAMAKWGQGYVSLEVVDRLLICRTMSASLRGRPLKWPQGESNMSATRIVAACLAAVVAVTTAPAATAFPFTRLEANIDFDQAASGRTFGTLVERASGLGLVYLDWTFANPNKSHVLAPNLEESARDGSCTGVPVERTGEIIYSGSPDPNNHHILVTIAIPAHSQHVFTEVRCEEYSSSQAVFTIKGFFRVYSARIATAFEHDFRSVEVEPALIRPGFFRR